IWRDLKDFVQDQLHLPWDEFNREPTAGISTTERLETMMDRACFALLVMTGEDQQPSGELRARENVVHEAGLFQGRLGFRRAIILLEDGCNAFSNIDGLTVLRFPKGHISAKVEEIRATLEREGILREHQ
ncbi:MAG TPA: TIR domain-containing protein, partial [Bryobacteraceae bacterium]